MKALERVTAAAALCVALVLGCNTTDVYREPQPLPTPSAAVPCVTSAFLQGCAVPSSGQAAVGALYRYELYSHCGIGYWLAWDFDGSFWDPVDPQTGAGDMNPPAGIGNPTDLGTIELTGEDTALFTSSSGMLIELRRSSDTDREGPLCA